MEDLVIIPAVCCQATGWPNEYYPAVIISALEPDSRLVDLLFEDATNLNAALPCVATCDCVRRTIQDFLLLLGFMDRKHLCLLECKTFLSGTLIFYYSYMIGRENLQQCLIQVMILESFMMRKYGQCNHRSLRDAYSVTEDATASK